MRTSHKFLLFGALFGLAFPVIATLLELFGPTTRPVSDTIVGIHTNDPLIMIIDTAPFFLGLFAYFIGQRQERSDNLNIELQATLDKLQGVQDRMIEQERLKSQFELASQVAHELKNPLNFIINFTEVSIDLVEECNMPAQETLEGDVEELNKLKAELQSNLKVIHKHGRRSGVILNELLRVDKAQQPAFA